MKTTTQKMKWIGRYNWLFLLTLLIPIYGNTAIVDHVFEKEIQVPAGISIRTTGMRTPPMSLHGYISSNTEKGFYTLRGRGNTVFYRMNKKLDVQTTAENAVKLTVSITIRAEESEIEKSILNDLERALQLNINADNSLDINCLLGIQKITNRNGWLRGNDNTIELLGGKKYKFDYLEIKAALSIPQQSNFELDSEWMGLHIGRLDGTLDVKMEGGAVFGVYANELIAKIKSTQLYIPELRKASISAHQSKVEIDRVEELTIGEIPMIYHGIGLMELRGNDYLIGASLSGKAKEYSALNKYKLKNVGDMLIASSINDQFSIDEVNSLRLKALNFSDIDIAKLMKSISGHFEYGEVNVYHINEATFDKIEMGSSFGSIRIFGEGLDHIKVSVKKSSRKQDTYLPGLSRTAPESISISDDYKKVVSQDDTIFIYQKGDPEKAEAFKGKIILTCDYCDVTLD